MVRVAEGRRKIILGLTYPKQTGFVCAPLNKRHAPLAATETKQLVFNAMGPLFRVLPVLMPHLVDL